MVHPHAGKEHHPTTERWTMANETFDAKRVRPYRDDIPIVKHALDEIDGLFQDFIASALAQRMNPEEFEAEMNETIVRAFELAQAVYETKGMTARDLAYHIVYTFLRIAFRSKVDDFLDARHTLNLLGFLSNERGLIDLELTALLEAYGRKLDL